jgi:hypothetical protein
MSLLAGAWWSVGAGIAPISVAADAGPDGASTTIVSAAPMDPSAAETTLAERADAAGALGIYYDFDANQYVIVESSSGPTISNVASLAAGLNVRVESRDITQADIKAILGAIDARSFDVAALQGAYAYFFMPRLGAVVVDVAGPTTAFSTLTAAWGKKILVRSGAGGPQAAYRHDDLAPHWGAAQLIFYPSGDVNGCTSGFTVHSSAGTQYMVSAGHCANFLQGVTVRGGTGLFWGNGTVAPTPGYDAVLISGSTYQGVVYTGNFQVQGHASVKNAGDPTVFSLSYCSSGYITSEQCGHHLVNTDTTFCEPSPCIQHVASFEDGMLTEDGDSGAPWYNYPPSGGVVIRGTHLGAIAPDMFIEKQSRIMSTFSVFITTN